MLAQNFQTPAELKISNAEYYALVHILGMMERGELKYYLPNRLRKDHDAKFSGLFNMGYIRAQTDCGTVGCILGTAQLLFTSELFERQWLAWKNDALESAVSRLFVPGIIPSRWSDITVEQAAIALRNYLTTGEASWAEVIKGT